jgi:hypothetical protein
MHRRIRSIVAVAAVAILTTATTATAGLSGAIFTTDEGGTFVNGNVYAGAELVYLNGGPRVNHSCTAAGLPDGDYYFQVTDPSGQDLLSSDALGERKVRVANGVVLTYLGTTHGTGTPARCGGQTVQLTPFDDTLNPGGEYKVWLTRIGELVCDEDQFTCDGAFLPSNSKTDNFKVQPPDVPDGGD